MTRYSCQQFANVTVAYVAGGQTVASLLTAVGRALDASCRKLSLYNIGQSNLYVDRTTARLDTNSLILMPNSAIVIPGTFNDLERIAVNPVGMGDTIQLNVMQEAD